MKAGVWVLLILVLGIGTVSGANTVDLQISVVEQEDTDRLVYNQIMLLGLGDAEEAKNYLKHDRRKLVTTTVTTNNKLYDPTNNQTKPEYTYRFGLSLIQRVSWLPHPLAEFLKTPGLNRVGFECNWVVDCKREYEKEVFYDIPLKKSRSSQQSFLESSPFNFTTSANTKLAVRIPFLLIKDYPLSVQFPIDGMLTLRKSSILTKPTTTPNIFNNQGFIKQLAETLVKDPQPVSRWILDINRRPGQSFIRYNPTQETIWSLAKPSIPISWIPAPQGHISTRILLTSVSNCTSTQPSTDCKSMPIRYHRKPLVNPSNPQHRRRREHEHRDRPVPVHSPNDRKDLLISRV